MGARGLQAVSLVTCCAGTRCRKGCMPPASPYACSASNMSREEKHKTYRPQNVPYSHVLAERNVRAARQFVGVRVVAQHKGHHHGTLLLASYHTWQTAFDKR